MKTGFALWHGGWRRRAGFAFLPVLFVALAVSDGLRRLKERLW